MKKVTRFVRFLGLDVHADTIVGACIDERGELRDLGKVANTEGGLRKLVKQAGGPEGLIACYEAGPCGYVTYWQLERMGVRCQVIAPTLIPKKSGDRVKTDRRDAQKLARYLRSGDLVPVWVPDPAHEALRNLVRAREAAKVDQLRARHRLSKFLLRSGKRCDVPSKTSKHRTATPWSYQYMEWVAGLKFEQVADQETLTDFLHEVVHMGERVTRLDQAIGRAVQNAPAEQRAVIEGLQALRGVAEVTAVALVAELGQLSRFKEPKQLMAYVGMVPREHSSGQQVRKGGITKTGNRHIRRLVGESAWSCRHRPNVAPALKRRQQGVAQDIKDIAWKAQNRLHRRYQSLTSRGKHHNLVITAVGRELLGFMWAVATHIETQHAGKTNQ